MSKILLPGRAYYSKIQKVSCSDFAYGILCTPPFNREREIEIIAKKCAYSLIEKPVLGPLPDNSMSGYVMQYCPTSAYVSDILVKEELKVDEIDVKVQSNLDFEEDNSSWRTKGAGSGLLSEFFGHAITFCLSPIFKDSKLDIGHLDVIQNTANSIELILNINGIKTRCVIEGNKNVRKTRYLCNYKLTNNQILYFDPYKVVRPEKSINIPKIVPDIAFFLRSYEFAVQCDRLVDKTGDLMAKDAIREIEKTMEKIR